MERELPLVRAISARALLELGDRAAAAERASASLEAALTISYDFPLALGLGDRGAGDRVRRGRDRGSNWRRCSWPPPS